MSELDGPGNNVEAIQSIFECFIINYMFMMQAGLECTFDRLKAAMDPQLQSCRIKSFDLNSLGLLKLVAPDILSFKVHDINSEDSDDENLFNLNNEKFDASSKKKNYLTVSLNLVEDEPEPKSKKRRKSKTGKGTSQRSCKISPQLMIKCKLDFEKNLDSKREYLIGTSWNDLLQVGLLQIPECIRCPVKPIVLNLHNDNLVNFRKEIARLKFYNGNIVYQKQLPAREPEFSKLDDLDERISIALNNINGITTDKLYCHQVHAIKSLRDGKHVCVSSSTSSGKSLTYSIPIMEMLLTDPNSTAILIFPTKALAQDQKLKLRSWLNELDLNGILVETFDGDTQETQRKQLRNSARVIITNPDMLHCAILPHHYLWKHFLENLKYVVLDEFHVYTGNFGAHVSLVLRRFRRIVSSHYGNDNLRFIALSATINLPLEQLKSLTGFSDETDRVELIEKDGSPSSSKDILVWRIDEDDTVGTAANLLSEFMSYNLRTIAFCKYRKQCEHILKSVSNINKNAIGKLDVYRCGYLAATRRETESSLRNGALTAVLATSALELGIDIGSINLTLHVNFPHSLSSLWQQMGRAGRRGEHSIALVLLNANQYPSDKFYVENPDEILNRNFDSASVSFEDSVILEQHLQCAALEKPIDLSKDDYYFGSQLLESCKKVLLTSKHSEFFFCNTHANPNPAISVSIRGTGDQDLIGLYCQGKLLEEIEYLRSFYEIYEGAVYLHAGETYIVTNIDIDILQASLSKISLNYITLPEFCMTPQIIAVVETRGEYVFGKLRVSCRLVKYQKFDTIKKKVIESVDVIRSRRSRFVTFGIWKTFKDEDEIAPEFKKLDDYFRNQCRFGDSVIIQRHGNQLMIFLKSPCEYSMHLKQRFEKLVDLV